ERLHFNWRRHDRGRLFNLAMSADFDPDVVAAARRHHGESIAVIDRRVDELVLNGAQLVERAPQRVGQQLAQHAYHGVERENALRERRLAPWGNDVRTL